MWLKRLYSIETVTATNREPAHCERCTLKATTKRTVLPLDQERLPYLRGLVLDTCSLTSGNFPSVFATTLIASKVRHVLVYARGQRPCMAESARRRAAVVLNPTQSRHRVDDATVTSQASFSTPAPQPLCHLRLGRAWRRSSRPSPALWVTAAYSAGTARRRAAVAPDNPSIWAPARLAPVPRAPDNAEPAPIRARAARAVTPEYPRAV